MTAPQFGEAEPGKTYPDRPAAFVVVARGDLIALVRVPWEGRGHVLHLPGGGIDPGETAAQAAIRECGEEAGLVVGLDAEPFSRADHYFLHHDGVVRNTRGAFFAGRITGEDPALKIEDDHELVWLAPAEAILRLDRPSHAFAVQEWLRLRAGGRGVSSGAMTAGIIEGQPVAERLRAEVATEVARLRADHGLQPGLAVVLVGEDPASQAYVNSKGEQSLAAGMHSVTHRLPADTRQAELMALVGDLNADSLIHGILVQLPLPKHLDEKAVIAAIDPDKDVDGLHVINAGRLVAGLPSLVACTPTGCLILLKATLGDLTGKHAVVVGRSLLVGKPIAQLLLAEDCTVTMAHSRTVDLPSVCRTADILVAAVGRPRMIRGDWIKPGACVIDVGINRVPFDNPEQAALGKTKIVGDVNYKEALEVAGWITPVPKGVGPMTVAVLLQNTVTAAKRQAGLDT